VAPWGRFISAVACQNASDPGLLTSINSIAEGLLEFAHAEGLPQVAQVAESACNCITQHLQKVLPRTINSSHSPAGVAGKALASQAGSWPTRPTVKECILTAICGFNPRSLEKEYRLWAAQQCTPLLLTWKPFFLVWMAASIVGCMRRGQGFNAGDLPTHAIMTSPHVLTVLLALTGLHRCGFFLQCT
jgi:hypothetical protein